MSEVPEHRRAERLVSKETLEKLADNAEAFLKTYTPPNHIWQAMKEFSKDAPDFRRELKQAIEKILRERARKEKEVIKPIEQPAPVAHLVLLKGQRGSEPTSPARPVENKIPQWVIDDAAISQRRFHPKDAYDSEAEEEVRKPI